MTLPEQGGFNERLDAIAEQFEVHDPRGQFADAIRTLVLEEIIGENNLSFSIPQGMPESMYNRLKGKDDLRAEQRKKLEDTNGTK